MGIYSALNVGITGVQSQSTRLAAISDNIANVNTVGYKQVEANFANIVAFDGSTGVYSPGGVRTGNRLLVDAAGLLRPTNNGTDLGISGDGMFVVSESATSLTALRYTRAGSFDTDQFGNLKNTNGFFLLGWRMDETGQMPATLNTSTLDTGTAFSSMQVVNLSQLSSAPVPTTNVDIKANLRATQTAFDFTPPNDYNALDVNINMAGGNITPHFERPFSIVDDQGVSHEFSMAFLKTATNTWSVEIFTRDTAAVTPTGTQVGGQIASGQITFNGDGTLSTVAPSLQGGITIDWAGAAANNTVTFDLGTAGVPFGTPNATVIGRADGLYQFDDRFYVDYLDQDGRPAGSLKSVSVDEEGYLTANYSNDTSRREFKIPLAHFRDTSQLTALTSNVFAQNEDTGLPNFLAISQAGMGKIVANTLEESNVELAGQLTTMIIAQRAYEANTKTISTSDEMLQRLDQMVR